MGRLKTIGRRAFLVGSVAVAGGVIFGTYVVRRPHDNPLSGTLEAGEVAFNPYVKLTSEGITVFAPHVDIGQGAQSLQAVLVAEELDVDPHQIRIAYADPAPAYYNTALANDLAPFMPFDDGLLAETTRGIIGAGVKVLGAMVTGGSTTVPDVYEKMRHAGAVARETLKQAASAQTGLDVSEIETRDGSVHLPDGTVLSYSSLAESAASIEPVQDVSLRASDHWRLIGKPMLRTDIVAKSTGTQNYGIDLRLDGMVYAAARLNPRQGGEMLAFDARDAETMRGVARVLEVSGTILEQDPDGTVRTREGKVGVAVIADNTWRAFQAVNAIDVDWGPGYYPDETEDHWRRVSESFTPERLDAEWRDDGTVENVLARGDVLRAEYRAPYVAHQPLEPLSAVIRFDGDRADVWAGHQMPRFAQDKVAGILGLEDAESVAFHNQFSGGSFGHRLEFSNIEIAADIARQMPGVPIKLTFSREEDFAQDTPRPIGMSRSRGRVEDGKVQAWSIDVATPSTTASQARRLGVPSAGPDMQIVAGIWNMPYDIPNLRVRGYRVPELAPISSWRSVGASSAGFFGEGFMDELCHAAGADPMEERLRLVNNDVHRKVLEAVAEMSDWGRPLGPDRGRGVALVESFGVPCAEVVEVTNTESGIRIDRVWVAADVGRVIDPVNFDNQVTGGVIWGLGHAINSQITFSDGMVEQTNFYTHDAVRHYQCPEVHVRGLENGPHVRGIGEPPVPPAAPALANAIFDATGQRIREMPFDKFIDFV